ncbi:hypothetical protein E4U55_001529 [Claviceps digitariae]|nr:hypothetical protein E4U55_001529 [Claviceps digitariae]
MARPEEWGSGRPVRHGKAFGSTTPDIAAVSSPVASCARHVVMSLPRLTSQVPITEPVQAS